MPLKDPRKIQSMFGAIAPVYDGLNLMFSLSIDKIWREFTAARALRPTDRRVLDVACGTGALTRILQRRAPAGCRVAGADFCLPMLQRGHRDARIPYLHADGLRLPFPDQSFDLVTVAFGLRNMVNTEAGLREMRRVLKPGGRLAILDFTVPRNPLVRQVYLLYFEQILPFVGRLVSGTTAYSYLTDSVLDWPRPRELARIVNRCGFGRVRHAELSFGIAVLHIAERGKDQSR